MKTLISALALVGAAPAFAQATPDEQSPDTSGAAAPDSSLANEREIVVTASAQTALDLTGKASTASRLNLTPMETPATINILSGDMIRTFGDTRLIDAISRAPGVSSSPVPGNGNNQYAARGFSGFSSVKQLYNGNELRIAGNTIVFPFDPWNVSRVEVLSGPASVLYGTGAIGGAINVITRQPDAERLGGRVELGYGSYDSLHAAADLTGPLTDTLAFRASISRYQSDSWIERGDSSSTAASIVLRYQPTSDFDVTVSGDFGDQHLSTYEGSVIRNGWFVPGLERVNYQAEDAYIVNRTRIASLDAHWRIAPNVTLHQFGYYAHTERPFQDITKFTYVPATDRVTRSGYRLISDQPYSQYGANGDITVRADLGSIENALVAGYQVVHGHAQRADNTSAAGSFVGSTSVDADIFEPGSFADGAITALAPKSWGTIDQLSFFGEDRIKFTDWLSVTAGIRYDRYKVDNYTIATDERVRADYAGLSVNVGVVFSPTRSTSIYAQFATASDPFGNLVSADAVQANYELSTGRQFEIGLKQLFWQDRIQLTLAGYQIVKHNLLTPTLANPVVSEQVGQQSSRGVELAVSAQLTPGLSIQANGTILRAKFDDFVASVGGAPTSLAGYVPLLVPEKTANASALWRFLPDWQLRAAVRYMGKRYTDNTNLSVLPQYTVADAGLAWTPKNWLKLDLRVNNVFDKRYAASSATGAVTQFIIGDPRTVMATVDVSF